MAGPHAAAVLMVLCLGASVQGARVTPIQKVLQMMDELTAKAEEEKKAEIQTFNEFTRFCKDTLREKSYAVKDATAAIEGLQADIQKFDSDVMVLGEEIKKLDAEVDTASHEKAEATEVREKANADYQRTHSDYVASIEDLTVGASKMKKMMASQGAAAGASFLQKMAATVRVSTAREALMSFLAMASRTRDMAADTEEPDSGGIVDMMKELEDKMSEEKSDLEKEEMQEQHGYAMTVQALDDQIKRASEKRAEKASTKKSKEAASATAKGELADTTNTKAEDEKYAAELTALCEQKSADFEARQKMRQEELEAIAKAKEIIGGGAVAGAGDKHLPGLAQLNAPSLAQLRSSTQRDTQTLASSFLKAQGQKFNSQILSLISVRASADPFVKVRKMIEDMIAKLMQEASDEAEHKGFCDEELSTNQATREEKSAAVQELTANIEEMTATSQQLAADMTRLNEETSAIDAAVAEATDVRNKEEAKNTQTVADAKQAIEAVSQAITVLKEFYDKAAGATALVQRGPADDVPATFDEPFTGSGGEGGILGMLDVILSDFQRLEAETTSEEEAAKKEYTTFMDDSAEDKETRHTDVVDKNRQQIKLKHEIKLAKKDLKSTQAELDSALEYYEKLKPSCVDAGVSYEERVAQRKQEIESLKEALTILEGEQ